MKLLPVAGGKPAIVDDDDFERLSKRKWFWNGRYVVSSKWDKIKKRVFATLLHRAVLSLGCGGMVDHIDHNPLNNQKKNLRRCDNRLNQGNQRHSLKSYSNFRGIHFVQKRGVWQAQIRDHGKLKWLGYFKEEEAAARAYDAAAIKVFGKFANLNFGERK